MDTTANPNPNNKESLGQRMFNSMRTSNNKVAQIIADTGERDTLGDMLSRSIRVAIKLQSLGIGPGDLISSCTPNHKNSCIPFLATLFIGATPTTFDPNLPESDTTYLLNKIQPKIMFVALEFLDSIESCLEKANISTKIVVFGKHDMYPPFDNFLEKSPKEDTFLPAPIKDTKDTAIILFSSGTTGYPKGICISHYSLLNPLLFDGINQTLKHTQGILLAYTTLYWITGVVFLIKSILDAEVRVVCSHFDPKLFWTYLETYKVNFVFVAPYQAMDALDYKPPKVDCSNLKLILTGSCAVPKNLMDAFFNVFPNALVLNGYGMSEAAGMVAKFDPTKPEEMELQRRKPQSVGKIQPYIEWKVIDPDTRELLGPNQKGELLIKGDTFMNGYYKQDSSSAFDSDGYLKTGDIVYFDEDNCIFIEERAKEMFKYRGWHIVPTFLEGILLNHPAVKEAVVIGIPNKRDGDHPMAFVVLRNNCTASTDEITEFVNSQVSDAQKLRAGVRIIDKLPRTTTGKVKRREIRQRVLSQSI